MEFPSEIIENIGYYVYRLIDPRNGNTIYVGKGKGNRVFSHVKGSLDKIDSEEEDEITTKIKVIREIQVAGLEVIHVIHRHGMDSDTALEVESALIDAYPGLTNIAGGKGNDDFGSMHAKEIIQKFAAEPAIIQHKVLMINISRSIHQVDTYQATRLAWKLNPSKAELAELILSTNKGIIVGAFIADTWMEALAENFPGHEDEPWRYGFNGKEAPPEISSLYVGKRVPEKYRKKGAANPIRYSY